MQMTTKLLNEIRRRNEAGQNDTIIAEALGIKTCMVNEWRNKMGLPKRDDKRRSSTLYTVWDANSDELLACGTAEECAHYMGYKGKDGFLSMVSRATHGKQKKYAVEKVRRTA